MNSSAGMTITAATIAVMPPAPPLPVPPPAPAFRQVRQMTEKAGGATYEAMIAAGWSDELLIQHGMMVA